MLQGTQRQSERDIFKKQAKSDSAYQRFMRDADNLLAWDVPGQATQRKGNQTDSSAAYICSRQPSSIFCFQVCSRLRKVQQSALQAYLKYCEANSQHDDLCGQKSGGSSEARSVW